jgi:hypothetical protein
MRTTSGSDGIGLDTTFINAKPFATLRPCEPIRAGWIPILIPDATHRAKRLFNQPRALIDFHASEIQANSLDKLEQP